MNGFIGLLAIVLLFSFSADAQMQPVKQCNGEDACCGNEKAKGTIVNKKTVYPMVTTVKTRQVACKLTTPELRKRKEEVIAVLKGKVLEKVEIKDGYRYTFEGSDTIMDYLVEFIKTERQCCNFFTFNLTVADEESNLWLSLTGPSGTKEFIKEELDL